MTSPTPTDEKAPTHIAVYWFVKNPLRRDMAIAAMNEVLKGYSWVTPLPGYYIIRMGSESDRQLFREKLLRFAQANPGTVQYVITPLMQGRYTGFLPKSAWTKIKERTGQ